MGEESSGGGSWWGGWLQAAKDKSSEAMTFIKRDLDEFASAVQSDTRLLVESTTNTMNTIREKMVLPEEEHSDSPSSTAETQNSTQPPSQNDPKGPCKPVHVTDSTTLDEDQPESDIIDPFQLFGFPDGGNQVREMAAKTGQYVSKGFSSFLSSVSQALTIPPDDDDEDPILLRDGVILDGLSSRLHCLRVNPATYCNEPDGTDDGYEKWLDGTDLEEQKSEIASLLVDCPEMRALYTQLVPAVISHAQFWSRYFYKVEKLEREEKRRAALKARADMSAMVDDQDGDLGWGDDDEDATTVVSQPTMAPTSKSPMALNEPNPSTTPALKTTATPALTTSSASPKHASLDSLSSLAVSPVSDALPSMALSSVEIDAILRREDDEVRKSSSPPQSIDPKTVDEILERESSPESSPKKTKTVKGSEKEEPIINLLKASVNQPSVTESNDVIQNITAETENFPSETTNVKNCSPGEVEASLKGLVVVDGTSEDTAVENRTTPTPPSSKESAASGDDWEKEFEVELTEEEKHIVTQMGGEGSDDWENWE